MPTPLLNIGVIGYGYWGPNLVRNFLGLDGLNVKAIADLNFDKLKPLAKLYPSLNLTQDFKEVVNDKDINAVIVATPVSSHYEIAKAALEAGKHCFVEKPIADTSEHAQELIELAEKNGVKLFVDYTFLFTGAVRKMKEIIDKGELGEILYFDSVRINLGLFQHDVNVVWDLAPHDLSIMDFLIGRKPKAVSAVGACHVVNNLENVAYVSVIFDDNLVAHFHVNWMAPVKMRQIIIGGSEKMLIYDEMAAEKIKIYDRGVSSPMDKPDKVPQSRVSYRMGDMVAPKIDQTEALAVECEYMLRSILTGEKAINDGEAGLRVVKILEAASESISKGGASVSID